jgi:hypothetical protein
MIAQNMQPELHVVIGWASLIFLLGFLAGMALAIVWHKIGEEQARSEQAEAYGAGPLVLPQASIRAGGQIFGPEVVDGKYVVHPDPGSTILFRATDGESLPGQKAWGELPYEELAPMFLDQFLIRYFHDLMKPPDMRMLQTPWKAFLETNPWAKEMPTLFWLLTSYKLKEQQLNFAIAEYTERMAKLSAENPSPVFRGGWSRE